MSRRRHRNLNPATAGPFRVRPVWIAAKGCYYAQWTNATTGETGRRSLKTSDVRHADRLCHQLAEELAAHREADRAGWRAIRRRYEREHLAGLSADYRESFRLAVGHFEDLVGPRQLTDADASAASRYLAGLRELGLAPASIASYAGALRAFLRWAARLVDGTYQAPRLTAPQPRKGRMMRGRPVTAEEFERILAKAEDVVGAAHAAGWRHLIRGLYLSGLRRREALALAWDREDTLHVYHGPETRHTLAGRRPMLAILAEGEKGRRDRLLPMTPDFVAFLRQTPPLERAGHVFNPTTQRGRAHEDTVSQYVRKMAELAGVTTGLDRRGRRRWATAHDLRRSFGDRWAARVMPVVLKELMRHESIETTERYYYGQSAERTAAAVYAAHEAALAEALDSPPADSSQTEDGHHADPNRLDAAGGGLAGLFYDGEPRANARQK